MEPSWQPDPTGRHHYRWWDGAAWSDSVSDHGVVSVDPVRSSRVATVEVSTTPRIGAPADPSPVRGYSTEPLPTGPHVGRWIAAALVLLAGIGVGVYLLFVREEAGVLPETMGITTHRLDDEGDFVVRDIRLDDGDAVRFRVEGDPDRDLITYFMAVDDTATGQAMRYFTDYGTNIGATDADVLLSDLTEADDVLTDGDVQDALRGYTILQPADRCCAGVPDVGTFVATVDGEFRIVVVEAEGRESSVRIIVDKYRRQLFPYAEITDTLDDDVFFTDTGFFEDTEPFEPRA